MAEVVCRSKGAALEALNFLASVMPKGVQKETVLAVKAWVDKNANEGRITEERMNKLKAIFGEKDERKKGM
jgi:hypothetical protein